MTLIVAADAQDHLILAGDHCAVLSEVSNSGGPEQVLGNYRKIHQWKYGGIAASGDVFLMANWCRDVLRQEAAGQPVDLLEAARRAKASRTRSGVPPERSTGNLFFTLPGSQGFALHAVYIGAGQVRCEIIEPVSAVFSMREGTLGQEDSDAFTRRLRPSFFFADIEAFHIHCRALIQELYAGQSARDARVTSSFDLLLLEKATGVTLFWQAGGVNSQVLLPAQMR